MRLRTRLGTTPLDAALAVTFAVAGLVQAMAVPIAERGLGALFVLGTTLPLAWRRTRPVEAALVASAFWLIPLDGFPVLGFVVVILQFFSLGSYGEPTRAVALTTAWATATSVVGTLLGPEAEVAAVGAVLVVVAPVLAGRLVRHLRRQNAELTSLTAQLREERHRAEEAAVGAERARIAQELHDVVGHEVTLIAIQAEAATSALSLSPERAAEPVEAIRTTAHRTLAEIRAVLDVLSPVDADGRATEEGLVELTARARAAGIPNTLSVSGSPLPDHDAASLAVHRIVRECLTNAGRHAPGHAVTLCVEWTPDAVVVDVSNPTPLVASPTPGRGLTGIRHRAELLGGTYTASAAGGSFRVHVLIPTTGHHR
jgi:signal transduction histidine kinase